MKIDEMELLVRVADTGSMTQAARQLGLTPAAVSAAVQRLERQLDVRVFERTTRSLHPTDVGVVVLDGCREILSRWRRTLDEARGHRAELAGTVHLAAPADTSYQVLEPLLTELSLRHPGLRVVLAVSDAVQHLHREAIDLAIRYGPLVDSALHTRSLARAPLILVAAPAYLAQHGEPVSIDTLVEHRCLTLHAANQPQTEWVLEASGSKHAVAVQSALCGDGHLARRWAIAGMGIALKSLFDVVDDLETGRLQRVLPTVTGGIGGIHVVFPSRRFLPTRVRVLTEALAASFGERSERCRAWLESGGGR